MSEAIGRTEAGADERGSEPQPGQARRDDDLKAEYLLIQGQYEAFDQRALSLKALATPLLGAGLAVGLKDSSAALLIATMLVAASLWLLEAIWKAFQHCLRPRIETLEGWYRGSGPESCAPFQIYTEWGEEWRRRRFYSLRGLLPFLRLPFVFLPYAVVILFGAVLLLLPMR